METKRIVVAVVGLLFGLIAWGAPAARFAGTLTPDGSILRINLHEKRLEWLTPESTVARTVPLPVKVRARLCLAWGGGHLFMGQFGRRKVAELDENGRLVRTWRFPGGIVRVLTDDHRLIGFPVRFSPSGPLYWELNRDTGKIRKEAIAVSELLNGMTIPGEMDRKAVIMGLGWGAGCLDQGDVCYVPPVGSWLLRIRNGGIVHRQTIPFPAVVRMKRSVERSATGKPLQTSAVMDTKVGRIRSVEPGSWLGVYERKGPAMELFLWKQGEGVTARYAIPEGAGFHRVACGYRRIHGPANRGGPYPAVPVSR